MSIWNTRRKPFQRSKIHSNSFLIPNKKAPQNAKYSALRGILLPAAGVEPAQGRRVYVRIWGLCQISFQSNKKRAEPLPRPCEKRMHAENVLLTVSYCRPYQRHGNHSNSVRTPLHFQGPKTHPSACPLPSMTSVHGISEAYRHSAWIRKGSP